MSLDIISGIILINYLVEVVMRKLVLSAAVAMCFPLFAADFSVVNENTEPEVKQEEVSADTGCPCLFTGVYFGGGLGLKIAKPGATRFDNGHTSNHSLNTCIGSLIMGAGRSFNKFYLGAEVLCDFAKNRNVGLDGFAGNNPKVVHGGIIPSIVLRLGYIFPRSASLLYAKMGITSLHDKVDFGNGNVLKMNKLAPCACIGVEKAFGKKVSVRTECEWVFKADKTGTTVHGQIKSRNRGILNIRALVAYNIRYGA